MNILRHTQPDFKEQIARLLSRSSLFDPEIEARTREVIAQVQLRGDEALVELTARFDGARLVPKDLPVTRAEQVAAAILTPEPLQRAIEAAKRNVVKFARRALPRSWSIANTHGAEVGEKFDPIQRVGIYVPGGTAPLISTALMTVTLAKVAGCTDIVVCTPPAADGSINPSLLYTICLCGATEIYRVGGAQAIAAMALGTPTIRPVHKIFGPGNAYVVAAKRLLFGHVAVDLLPGPSELLVIADDSAEPRLIAADLLAQAEHGSGHERIWLVTSSARVLQRVNMALAQAVKSAPRLSYLKEVLDSNTWLVQTASLQEAVDLANAIAPEHCEIMTRMPHKVAMQIKTAGAIFVGRWSPTAVGDYVAGPNHTLPTGGAGRGQSGLSVEQFLRKTSIIKYSRASLARALPALNALAEAEGLLNHAASVAARFERSSRTRCTA